MYQIGVDYEANYKVMEADGPSSEKDGGWTKMESTFDGDSFWGSVSGLGFCQEFHSAVSVGITTGCTHSCFALSRPFELSSNKSKLDITTGLFRVSFS